MASSADTAPLYEQVKAHVLRRVANGELGTNERVPSENELVKALGVSRMTVNRALKDLTSEGILVRTPGVGTFVAPRLPQAHPLEIHNIADEIEARGHEHRTDVLFCDKLIANPQQSRDFQLPPRARLFQTQLVHHENDIPIQFEDRLVNPAVAPAYLEEDFSQHTPHEHLMKVAPLQRAEHVLRAAVPPAMVRDALKMDKDEPCLVLVRRTWSSNIVASCATLYYPGSRYEFAGSIK
jgi:GntR family transcriptional regulator, histidine utilization repressor